MSLPSRTHTLRTSLYTYIYPQVCIYIISYDKYFLYMNSSCAKSHMSLPLPVHTLKRVLTLRTSLYTKKHSQKYIFHITNTFCVWLRVVRTHICLCPCECSQLEPLCIHRDTHKFTYFILQILLCGTPLLCELTYVCALASAHTQNLFVYIHILTSIHISRIISRNTLVYRPVAVHSHTCLCPCECSNFEPVCIHAYAHKHTYVISKNTLVYNPILCKLTNGCALSKCSHLEPLCIHRYTHKYTCFILQILLYVNPCCANSHMSVPLRVLTVRTSLYTCMCSQVYIYSITDLYMNPCCASWHMFVPLRVLTPRTSLYTYIYSQVYIYQESYHGYVGISDLCCALSHLFVPLRMLKFWNLFVYMHMLTNILMLYQKILLYITQILCKLTNGCALSKCSHLEPLCIHRYTQKNAYFILQILLCMTPCCANLHMSVPLRVLTVRTSLYTCMYSQVYIFSITDFCIWTHVVQADICLYPCECSHIERHCIHTYTHKYTYIKNHITDTLVYQPVLCTLTLVCALASAHT